MPIQCFRARDTEVLFTTGKGRRWSSIAKIALRRLDMLNAAIDLTDLCLPPGNRLEVLSGDRAGEHSIRINDQSRLCFVWTVAGPEAVELADYQ